MTYSPRPFTEPEAQQFLSALREMFGYRIRARIEDGTTISWLFREDRGAFKKARSVAEFYWQEEERLSA